MSSIFTRTREALATLLDWFQHLEPTDSGGDDFVGDGFPEERFGVSDIVVGDEVVDGGPRVDQGTEDATFEPAPGQLGEEALDGVQPRR